MSCCDKTSAKFYLREARKETQKRLFNSSKNTKQCTLPVWSRMASLSEAKSRFIGRESSGKKQRNATQNWTNRKNRAQSRWSTMHNQPKAWASTQLTRNLQEIDLSLQHQMNTFAWRRCAFEIRRTHKLLSLHTTVNGIFVLFYWETPTKVSKLTHLWEISCRRAGLIW